MTSDVRQFSVVCEGPSDYCVIEAVLVAVFGDVDFILQRIQPLESLYGGDAGPYGGGWKGVRAWCEATRDKWGSVGASRAGITGDILIIHIDADVAGEPEINCAQPCPPADPTVRNLRAEMLGWLGNATVPDWIVLCTPSKDMDAWVLTALYPNDPWVSRNIECRLGSAVRLRNKPEKLVRQRGGRIQKLAPAYKVVGRRITDAWPRVKARCSEANRFDVELRAFWNV
jgi:hypothetical protein